ncbi:MAG TPA: hypothetical protein VKD72_37955 [Gemmataceae bacterium]|nr:hypothetical protein [Gemmataceae bacterium]
MFIDQSLLHLTDDQLGMTHADAREDLALVLEALPLPALVRTKEAAENGRFIRGAYRDAAGRGCVMHFLTGATSKTELLSYDFGSEQALWAARRIVRWFDYGTLSFEMVSEMLGEHIASRRAARRAEEEELVLAC